VFATRVETFSTASAHCASWRVSAIGAKREWTVRERDASDPKLTIHGVISHFDSRQHIVKFGYNCQAILRSFLQRVYLGRYLLDFS
jgi:hypothetical protein